MAIIPAMTTGMIDFMISSGLITLIAAIPVPLLAVPYAAPSAETNENERSDHALQSGRALKKRRKPPSSPLKTMADVAPITPKNATYAGLSSDIVFKFKLKCPRLYTASYKMAERKDEHGDHET